jgi:shikimate 5-dehydrogenase
MQQQINKDTKIYGSFSETPGNNGCIFFNNAFEKYNINAIYKSFYSNDIKKTIEAVKHLEFSGFALSMPHKITVIPHLNHLDEISHKIGAVNTVINTNGELTGYNTDFFGIIDFFSYINIDKNINIIGNGGFSKAIQYACRKLNIEYKIFERKDIDTIPSILNETFINATPIEIKSIYSRIIDLRPNTFYGKMVAENQAKHQFKLYTGIDYATA